MKKTIYNHKKIEKKWQKVWLEKKIFKTKEKTGTDSLYVLDMFPYPSGAGLHVGHPKGYIATDIYARYLHMTGKNVLHPMGWDAFGLPAENYAIKNKIHPRKAVDQNIKRYKQQLEIIGFSYDWEREVDTTQPEYYRWTQWAFLKMWEKGLAFESYEPINWCPSCKTGLANEDLEKDGTCERCGSMVEKKPMRQWVIKITDYADRLLNDLGKLTMWPNSIIESQRNWIGRSEGAEIDFPLSAKSGSALGGWSNESIKVFTTRPDTLFGVTYVVLSPEHELVKELLPAVSNKKEVEKFIEDLKSKTEIDRTAEGKEKNGIELVGIKAINPANGEEVPVWIADYVLATYGTGAVMAVPAHDERDFAFAKKYNLAVREVVVPNFVDTVVPPENNKEYFQTKSVSIIVKHWSEDKYILLDWKVTPRVTFVTGTVEEGENPDKTALREITEETGYYDFDSIEKLGEAHSMFYADWKDKNYDTHIYGYIIKLKSGKQKSVIEKETLKHTPNWVDSAEIEEKILQTKKDSRFSIYFWNKYLKPNAYTSNGVLVASEKFDYMDSVESKNEITTSVKGKWVTKYKLRDWVFSRQRYWGEPIPLVHCDKCGVVGIPEKDLPVVLPNVKSYEPTGTGESPLASISKWVNTECPKCKGPAKRETNTMPQWAGSCWYYLRYMDPKNKKALVDSKKEKMWDPVDVYVGGAEHATRHLIYARFWHKFLKDIGVVSTDEPFKNLKNQGLIMGSDGRKMSKRYGNVVNPDEVVKNYGADTLRVYEMFMAPFEAASNWDEKGIIGSRRFLERVWRLHEKLDKKAKLSKDTERILNETIKKVGEDIVDFKFNTAISSMMILVNELEKCEKMTPTTLKSLLLLLAPFAPHMVDELFEMMGEKKFAYQSKWPKCDESKMVRDTISLAVQVNGKLRGVIEVSPTAEEKVALEIANNDESVKKWLVDKRVMKVIYIKGKILNLIVA